MDGYVFVGDSFSILQLVVALFVSFWLTFECFGYAIRQIRLAMYYKDKEARFEDFFFDRRDPNNSSFFSRYR